MTSADIYAQAKANGCTDRLAEMLAARRPPGSVSDKEYLAGQTNGVQTAYLRRMAKKLYGFNPGPGDVYVPQLARFGKPFDPQAWVPPGRGRGHVKAVCEANGWGCDGMVKTTKVNDVAPAPEVPLAEDIVRETAAKMIKENPEVARMKKGELREQIVKRHGRPKK